MYRKYNLCLAIKLNWLSLLSLHSFLFMQKWPKTTPPSCYVQLGLRFTTYVYLPPLLTLQSTVIVSRKYYLLVKLSYILIVQARLRLRLTTFSGTVTKGPTNLYQ